MECHTSLASSNEFLMIRYPRAGLVRCTITDVRRIKSIVYRRRMRSQERRKNLTRSSM